MKEFSALGWSDKDMLTELSKRTGGVPDFAKKLLVEKGGMSAEDVEAADAAGKKDK